MKLFITYDITNAIKGNRSALIYGINKTMPAYHRNNVLAIYVDDAANSTQLNQIIKQTIKALDVDNCFLHGYTAQGFLVTVERDQVNNLIEGANNETL